MKTSYIPLALCMLAAAEMLCSSCRGGHSTNTSAQCTAAENRRLAYGYETGDGKPRDIETALSYYSAAAQQGDPEAQYRLAMFLVSGSDKNRNMQSIRLCSSAASNGNAEAQLRLGFLCANGGDVPRDYEQAMKWTSMAATQGLARAMMELGYYYQQGFGVQLDYETAMKWYKKGADAGDADAMFSIGKMYRGQKGPYTDFREAVYWTYKAALAGHKEAADFIMEMRTVAGEEMWKRDIRAIKRKFIAEDDDTALLIKQGATTNLVLSLLGRPASTSRSGKGAAPNTEWTDHWDYEEGTVSFRDGVVTETDFCLTTEAYKVKQATATNRIDLWAYPFLKPDNPEYWACATTAVLTEFNGRRHDILGGRLPSKDAARHEALFLYRWWGVRNRESLLDTLVWLESEGHRKQFDDVVAHLAALNAEELQQARQNLKVAVVLEHQKTLGKKSIIGWDLSRYIFLCRGGYLAGYLTEQEAVDRMRPIAKRLQSTFDSWADLGMNYLIGRDFWSGGDVKEGNDFRRVYDSLLARTISPWNLCPWRMNLDGKMPTAPEPPHGQTPP